MNKLFFSILFSQFILFSTYANEPTKVIKKVMIREIQEYNLNPRLVHTVYCHHKNTGVTTVMFPSEITSLNAARVEVKYDEKNPTPFLLSYVPGNYFFTVKALGKIGVKGAINVVFNKNIYVIHLETVERGHSSVTFKFPRQPQVEIVGSGEVGKSITPNLILSMIDKAKAYNLFKKSYPAQVSHLDVFEPKSIMNFKKHSITLHRVIRYPGSDTLIFDVELKNHTNTEQSYSPRDFAVNVGEKIYYSSLADASGKIPPNGVSYAYFAVTGNKAGGKNHLAAKNNWKVLLPLTEKKVAKPIVQKVKEKPKALIPLIPYSESEKKSEKKLPVLPSLPETKKSDKVK